MASKYAIETAFRLIDEVSRPLGKITGSTKATSRALKNLYAGMESATARLGKGISKLGGKLAGAFGLAGVLNIDKVVGFLTKDITNAIEFQTALAKVGTIADTSSLSLDVLSKDILGLSSKMGVGANEIAESAYQAISAGVSTEKALFAVEAATKAGIAGFTDTATAIDGLTSVLNAYGLQTEKITDISDQMLIAQNLGKTSFGDMSSTMGQVIPTAAALNVKTGELFASIASLTANAIPTSQAMTSLKAALSNVIKPGSNAVKMAESLGLEFNAAALQGKGFAAFLEDVKNKTGGNQEVLAQLFGSTEAVNAINVLIGSGSDLFDKALGEMQNAAGATETAFAKMMDTPEKRWGKVMNTIRNAGISFGTAILPVVEQVIGKIGVFADSLAKVDFSQFRGAVESIVGAVSFLTGALVGALKTAWAFRGVIVAAGVVLGTYYGVSMLVVGAMKAITIWKNIARAVSLAHAIMLGKETVALALLKKGTLAYAIVQKAFVLADKARLVMLNLLTGGMLAQKAAVAALAVANGTATKAQWLLNAAMTANPIGIIIAAVAALILIIVLLVKHWDSFVGAIKTGSAKVMTVLSAICFPIGLIVSIIREVITSWDSLKKAFTDGGILKGLLRLGGVLLSAVLAPVQGLLEILSYIPGVGWLAGKGAEKLAGLRNNLRGDEKVVANIKAPKVTPQIETPDEAAASVVPDFSDLSLPMLNTPSFDLPGFKGSSSEGAVSGAGGKSKIHGVYDISGAAPSMGGSAGSAKQSVAQSAQSAVDSAVSMILNVVRSIDANITRIAAWSFAPEGQLIPAPVTQGERTAYSMQERREVSIIELRAAQGTDAEIKQTSPETNIRLIRSGGNI